MKAWELDEVRRAVKGKWLTRTETDAAGAASGRPGGATRGFTGQVSTDSRTLTDGDLFFAIKGGRYDAHDFLADVIARRPAAAIVHREPAPDSLAAARENGVALIQVDDTIAALNRLAAAYRATMRAKVIAVGGSNGKTTTKRILHALLTEKFGADGGCASPKSFNNNIGMPLTLLDVAPGHDFVVLEIGTNAPGEIAALGEVCRPDIAVITNVGLEHLELLGDLEGVAREEASIAPFVADGGAGGTLVMPADAPELQAALKHSKAKRILVGRGEEQGDLTVTDLQQVADDGITGVRFSINARGSFFLPLLGEHNAVNALMAIAAARRLGVTDEQIVAGLAKVAPAEGRLQVLQAGAWTVIHDAYNANPSSMEAALKTFAKIAVPGRRVVVLADMLELGPSSDALHRTIGGMTAAWKFDLFIAIGPHMQVAADAAKAAHGKAAASVVHFEDTAAACAGLVPLLQPHDTLLLKGSHGMALETLLDPLRKGAVTAAPNAAATKTDTPKPRKPTRKTAAK